MYIVVLEIMLFSPTSQGSVRAVITQLFIAEKLSLSPSETVVMTSGSTPFLEEMQNTVQLIVN